jgi:hypothetical protein
VQLVVGLTLIRTLEVVLALARKRLATKNHVVFIALIFHHIQLAKGGSVEIKRSGVQPVINYPDC